MIQKVSGEEHTFEARERDGVAKTMKKTESRRLREIRRRRRRRKRNFMLTVLVGMSVILGGAALSLGFLNQEAALPSMLSEGNTENNDTDIQTELGQINSAYAVLMDAESGHHLGEKKAEEKIYPASLTKIMTAIVAIENSESLDERIEIPAYFFQQLYAENASMAGFQPGETASLRDLVYGILLPSGAECCLAFADRISGSESAFVEKMNQKAEALGLSHTHFCNSTGLHDPEHYSTVKDLSVLLQYALKNQDFRDAFTSSRYSIPPTTQHPDGFTFHSTMFQYMDTREIPGGEILGGKTGYTQEAGLCLASLAEVNGREYILVTAKAEGNHQTEQYHIIDAKNVYGQLAKISFP